MKAGEHIVGGLAMIAILTGPSAAAVEVNELLGNWGGDEFHAYDCKGAPGSEIMPVTVSRGEAGEISVGAYEWGCSATKWQERGPFIWTDTACGHEGTEETTNERVELALSSDGRLILVRDNSIDVLTRCPAEVQ
ncbi:MAG: hypothetical protein JNM20_16370 [Rhizobiales bacterium]|nr:hypothetical protein [Hyphomicrobiales bacterium]